MEQRSIDKTVFHPVKNVMQVQTMDMHMYADYVLNIGIYEYKIKSIIFSIRSWTSATLWLI